MVKQLLRFEYLFQNVLRFSKPKHSYVTVLVIGNYLETKHS